MVTCDFCGKSISAEHAGATRHRRCMGKVKPRASLFDAPFKVGDAVEYRPLLPPGVQPAIRTGSRGVVMTVYAQTGRVRVAIENGPTVALSTDSLRKAA